MGKSTLAIKFCGLMALCQSWGLVWGMKVLLNGMSFADAAVNLFKFYRSWRGL
jgi:hypothetical protein